MQQVLRCLTLRYGLIVQRSVQSQLIQVFMNLVRNAADALPETGGEITLTTGYRPGVRFGAPVAGERLSLPLEVTVREV